MISEDITKITRAIELRIFPILITGTQTQMSSTRGLLEKGLTQKGHRVKTLDLNNPQEMEVNLDKDFLIVWGLEALDPFDPRTFSIRTTIDGGKHQGLRVVIFCEQDRYRDHFHNNKAPFYHFCVPLILES